MFSSHRCCCSVLSQSKSTNAFQWLRGYNGCRTGWDRFSKPTMTDRPPFGKAGVGGSQSSQTTALPGMKMILIYLSLYPYTFLLFQTCGLGVISSHQALMVQHLWQVCVFFWAWLCFLFFFKPILCLVYFHIATTFNCLPTWLVTHPHYHQGHPTCPPTLHIPPPSHPTCPNPLHHHSTCPTHPHGHSTCIVIPTVIKFHHAHCLLPQVHHFLSPIAIIIIMSFSRDDVICGDTPFCLLTLSQLVSCLRTLTHYLPTNPHPNQTCSSNSHWAMYAT